MPTLAICRGFQLLNVARGGDLVQHLPEAVGNDVHKQVPGEFAVHPVEVKDGSRLGSIVGAGSDVTSHHHQGLGRLGDGLVETAWAEDGTLEAVEDPSLAVRRRRAVAPRGRGGRRALRGARRAGTRVPRHPNAVGSRSAHVDFRRLLVYFAFFFIYLALSIAFIVDVLRQPSTALSGAGKALWILALLAVPVFAWVVYGMWRLRQTRTY